MTPNSSQTTSRPAHPQVQDELAIRFVNTAAWRLRTPSEERLPDADALFTWFAANDLAEPKALKALSRACRADPRRAEALYGTAIGLREAIYDILVARMASRAPSHAALDLFNQLLARAGQGADVSWRPGQLVWSVCPQGDDLALLRPIIVSAADLVTGPRGSRVKQCQDDRGCGWLFVDESRAQNRRWCSMGDCGNRAKAHRHYHRTLAQERR